MNFFSKKRFSLWTIVLLIGLNLFTLSIIWFNQIIKPGEFPRRPPRQSEKPLQLLQEELDLSDEQIKRYDLLRRDHHQQTQILIREIPRLKREMMDEIFKSNADTLKVMEISKLIGEKQTEIEQVTFDHLLDLKELCGEKQAAKLHGLLEEFFHRQQPMERHRLPQHRDRNRPMEPRPHD
ncbi:periplasmic heavy metal sensor [candidate division KSB1 bacterium]|nr:periplasmic heavy metal sensor [candidate division KSB1 bacterium]